MNDMNDHQPNASDNAARFKRAARSGGISAAPSEMMLPAEKSRRRVAEIAIALLVFGGAWSAVPCVLAGELGRSISAYAHDAKLPCNASGLDVRQYGASGSLRSTQAVTSAGSNTIRVAGVEDFRVGQRVAVLNAGAATSLQAPTGLVAQAMTYNQSGMVITPGCVADKRNSGCDAVWIWRVVAVDSRDGMTAPGAPATVSRGPKNPNPTNRIRLYWNSDANARGYLVYGCQGAGCRPTLRAALPNNWYTTVNESSCAGCSRPVYMGYWYMGHDFGTDGVSGRSLPEVPRHETLFGTIAAIEGNTIRLDKTAGASNSAARLVHDDSPAFQAVINLAKGTAGTPTSNGGLIFMPPGQYPIAQTLEFYRTTNIHLFGAGGEGNSNMTQLVWLGAAGGTVFSVNQSRDLLFENFAVTDSGGASQASTPGVILDIDKYDAGQGITFNTTHNRFRDLSLQRSGIAVRVANCGSSNDEMMRFDDVIIDAPWNAQGGWYGYYFGGAWQTYDEQINGGSVAFRDAALYLNGAGSVDTYALNLSHNLIDWYVNNTVGHVIETASDSEGAAQHLYVSFGSTGINRIVIRDSRLVDDGQNLASNGYYVVDNASQGLKLEGNDIRSGNSATDKILFSGALISVSNRYGDPDPFVIPRGAKMELVSVMDRACIDRDCHQAKLRYSIEESRAAEIFRGAPDESHRLPW